MTRMRTVWLLASACLATLAVSQGPPAESECEPLEPEFDENTHVYDGCWEIESGSPPTVVPLFDWEPIHEPPDIQLSGDVSPRWDSDCYGGYGIADYAFTAPSHAVEKGRIGWRTEDTDCIPEGGEEEEIDLSVVWTWTAPGGADPESGSGETAGFRFGSVAAGCYDVVFTATGTPDWPGCPDVTVSATGTISVMDIELTVPGQVNTCCTPETRAAYLTVNTGCDSVEIDGVEWSALPEGLLTLTTETDDPTQVTIENIKWYPGEGREQCDRTCEYVITANVQLSNGETCSVSDSFKVEAMLHHDACFNYSMSVDGEPTISILEGGPACPYQAILNAGTFRIICHAGGISMGAVTIECPFYTVIYAEELAHQAQCENMENSPPPGLDPALIIAKFNSTPYCGNTPEEAETMLYIIPIKDRLKQIAYGMVERGELAYCWKEYDAKNKASQTGPLYFYAYECIYGPDCEEHNFGSGGEE